MFSFEDQDYSLQSMLDANCDDAELCAWLETAAVGEEYATGGATGLSTVARIA